MMHLLLHTLEESWLMLPILYITYLIIEHFERKESNDDFLFKHLQKYGPLFGAVVGLIPQCGFSIIAAMLYISRYITFGTLISVFIATSDEAIPVLIAHPHLFKEMIGMLIIKLVVAIVVGYIVDYVLFPKQKLSSLEDIEEVDDEDMEESTNTCPCCYVEYPIYVSAFLRALKIYFFIFVVTFGLNFLLHDSGEFLISSLLLQYPILQVLMTSLIGFIPNCVTSVVLTQLYVASQMSYGALIAGLITNAGLGIVALVRYQATRKEIIQAIFLLLITAILTGLTIQIIF